MSTHSASYSQTEQHRFLTGWFGGWSQLQREDFVPALAQQLKPGLYVNGLVGGLQRLGRPPSIFQCQVKLFQDWSETWTAEEKQQLRQALVQADPSFGALLEAALAEQQPDADGGGDADRGGSGEAETQSPTAEPVEAEGDAAADGEVSTEAGSVDSQSSELTPTEI